MRDPFEPRPRCPECGRVVHPTRAFPYGNAKSIANQVLEGIYDRADCLLDAIERGYPKDRALRS